MWQVLPILTETLEHNVWPAGPALLDNCETFVRLVRFARDEKAGWDALKLK